MKAFAGDGAGRAIVEGGIFIVKIFAQTRKMYANASEIFKLRVFSFALKFRTRMLLPLFCVL